MKTVWLDEGLKILAAKGPASLSIESLTSATGKTKGSFYHHFSSREQYVEQLLAYHEKRTIDEIIDLVGREKSPREQLKKLTTLTFQISSDVELAIRAWALYDPIVKNYQKRLDERRMEQVRDLHIRSGIDADRAEVLSCRDYALFLGLQQLRSRFSSTQIRKVLRAVYSSEL